MTRIDTTPIQFLASDVLPTWRLMQAENEHLKSPFFSPEFSLAVEKVTGDVWLALERDEFGRLLSLLPFQRRLDGSGVPIAFPYSDYHGLISRSDHQVDPRHMVRKCGLNVWDFHYLPESQSSFDSFTWRINESPVIDLPLGGRHASERRKLRKLEREVGPIQFEAYSQDSQSRELLIRWKREQCQRTGVPDLFKDQWMQELVATLQRTQSRTFSGAMTTLRAGEELVAAHFGMHTSHTWHSWFPVYNPKFQKYSPGLLLLVELIAFADKAGIKRFDFGAGPESYKRRFCNSTLKIRRGSVPVSVVKRMSRSAELHARRVVEHFNLLATAKSLRQRMQG